jgi:hypothetical protein
MMGASLALCRAEEAEGQVGSSGFSFASCRKVNTDAADLSHGDFPADLHGMRRRLPDEWAGFLKQHFNADVRMIRAFFGCDEKTARDWLSGKHGVNGAPLLMLIRENRAARQFFLGEAA